MARRGKSIACFLTSGAATRQTACRPSFSTSALTRGLEATSMVPAGRSVLPALTAFSIASIYIGRGNEADGLQTELFDFGFDARAGSYEHGARGQIGIAGLDRLLDGVERQVLAAVAPGSQTEQARG